MRWVPGGTFAMGSEEHYPEEAPVREATVGGFWLDEHPVTNLEFTRFVKETGHVTSRGGRPEADAYPVRSPSSSSPARSPSSARPGRSTSASRTSGGPGGAGPTGAIPKGRRARCTVASDTPSCTSPTPTPRRTPRGRGRSCRREAEWEFAARGGLEGAEYAWGDEFLPKGRPQANTWQGEFPYENTLLDGYEGTSPVGSFPPNGFGLLDMIGNVWEWTTDWYAAGHEASSPCCVADPRAASIDPNDPAAIPRRVMKGGSHLCAPNYCRRYRPAARMAQAIDTSTNHLGFRCLVRAG